jgi:hypothetical protein
MGWSKLTDMAMSSEERADYGVPAALDDKPAYPYGLRIRLEDDQLEKLGLEADCDPGDIIDLRCFAVVTSVSINRRADGTDCSCVELQIQKLAIENEMTEEEEDDD